MIIQKYTIVVFIFILSYNQNPFLAFFFSILYLFAIFMDLILDLIAIFDEKENNRDRG